MTGPPPSPPPGGAPRSRRHGAGSRALAVALTVLSLAALGLLSSLPLPGEAPEEALLRMSWRLRGEEAGECPRPTEEELQALPSHMRNPDACVGELPPYRLRLWVDGSLRLDDQVRGGGLRSDRPLTVYRELTVEPGTHTVRVEFVREDEEGSPEPTAVALALEADAQADAGGVLLISRRQDTGALEMRVPEP